MYQSPESKNDSAGRQAYLGQLGAWALAFGCSVGWGSFVMPGTTFLPIAGPVGSAIGLVAGGLVMLILALNYHYLMNRYPAAERIPIRGPVSGMIMDLSAHGFSC